jgi:formylglycine-generating enzyme required for sulfatase activity
MYPAATKAYKLPKSELGYQTVRVQYLDGANNYSPVYNDYIKLVAAPTEETILLPGNVPLVMKWIPAGSFNMGMSDGDTGGRANELPQHSVTLAGFWMAKYELTKRQWTAVMGTTPWTSLSPDFLNTDLNSPATWVSWDDAHAFTAALNTYTGKKFQMPSEAQWEYAYRAGTTTSLYWGEDISATTDYCWDATNGYLSAGTFVQVVGQKLPNAWGLYDMGGNACEFVEDDYHATYAGAPTDGSAWVDSPRGQWRIYRGGAMNTSYFSCRASNREADAYSMSQLYEFGFRVVRIP